MRCHFRAGWGVCPSGTTPIFRLSRFPLLFFSYSSQAISRTLGLRAKPRRFRDNHVRPKKHPSGRHINRHRRMFTRVLATVILSWCLSWCHVPVQLQDQLR